MTIYGKVNSVGKESIDNRQQKLFLALWKIPFYFYFLAAKTNLVQNYKQVPPIVSHNMLFFKYLWWVGPSHQLSAHSHSHTPCSVGKKENRKTKEVQGSRQRQFNKWRKDNQKNPQTSDANAITQYLPQADQYSASLQAMATSQEPAFPQFAEGMMVVWHAVSFWSIWVSCLSCDLPTSCSCPAHSLGKTWGGESLETTQALLSSNQNIGVPPAHPKHSPKQAAVKQSISIPAASGIVF